MKNQELLAEDYLPREIKLIVIHCSATRCNIPFTPAQLEECHKSLGYKGTGYHFYITRDGGVHHTRPIEQIGKAWIHTTPGQDNQWDIREEEFMERMTESTKAVIDYFGKQITYVNVMRNMSVSCDCEGVNAAPVVTPNVGILSSTDMLALDQACVDLVYAMTEAEHHDLVERIESRHGLRQLSYMKELGMGNDRYILIDLDNGGKRITAAEAVEGLKPFVKE